MKPQNWTLRIFSKKYSRDDEAKLNFDNSKRIITFYGTVEEFITLEVDGMIKKRLGHENINIVSTTNGKELPEVSGRIFTYDVIKKMITQHNKNKYKG